MISIKRILASTDFSSASIKGLQYAKALASANEAVLCVVHVIPPPVYPLEAAMISRPYREIEEQVRERAVSTIAEICASELGEDVVWETRVEEGVPFVEIIQAARRWEADLIVIATHGYSGLKHVLLGSTAEKVVRKAPCPVLTVKDKEREFVMP